LDHEDSNYGLLKKELLDHITIGKPKCFAIDPSLNTSHDVAVHYEQTLVKALGPAPVLDLVLLGCGPDGHTCSLFPGHKLLNEKTRLVAEIEDSPKPPPRRVTLTFTTLAYASNITFVAEGAGKAPVLKDIFEHPEKRLPSSMVNGLHLPVTWFVNDDAIKGVNVTTSKF
jgi:6-phosphogluconolactonase